MAKRKKIHHVGFRVTEDFHKWMVAISAQSDEQPTTYLRDYLEAIQRAGLTLHELHALLRLYEDAAALAYGTTQNPLHLLSTALRTYGPQQTLGLLIRDES